MQSTFCLCNLIIVENHAFYQHLEDPSKSAILDVELPFKEYRDSSKGVRVDVTAFESVRTIGPCTTDLPMSSLEEVHFTGRGVLAKLSVEQLTRRAEQRGGILAFNFPDRNCTIK